MTDQSMTSSAFNRDSGAAKRAARRGPVVITERGTPSHVLMTWADYQRLAHPNRTLAEALAMPGGEDIDFDPPRLSDRPVAATFE